MHKILEDLKGGKVQIVWLVVYRNYLKLKKKKNRKKEQERRNGDVDEAQPITWPNHIE